MATPTTIPALSQGKNYVYDAYGMSTAYSSTNNSSLTSGIGNLYGYNGEYTDPATRILGIYDGKLPGNIEIWTIEGIIKE